MVAILWLTMLIILVYFSYPVCLNLFFPAASKSKKETDKIDGISIILLSYNGGKHLVEKTKQLLTEITFFKNGELILIDDSSTDNSLEPLKVFADEPNFRIIRKTTHSGIPDSMNLGVLEARNEIIVFSDQRQNVPVNGLKKFSDPLQFKNVGAVSGSLCQEEWPGCKSIARQHEHSIKVMESRTGNLIGIYGPLFAIKKSVYTPIPSHIILDDLYLTLKILASKQVLLIDNYSINDQNFPNLYNYARAKRYLLGFIQLLKEKDLIRKLNKEQIIMLIWHKYLRLLIPLFAGIAYFFSALLLTHRMEYQIYFAVITLIGLTAIFQWLISGRSKLLGILKIQVYYFLAFFDVIASRIPVIKNFGGKPKSNSIQSEFYEPLIK